MKKFKLLLATIAISALTSATTLAGAWVQDNIGWYYDNGDGTHITNKWEWLDSNGDGVAECYYFNERGYMAANMDVGGYWVNADGQWVDMYGTVQTKVINNNMSIAPVTQTESTNDYTSYNTNTGSVYDSMSDSELLNLITQSELGSQTNSDAVEAYNKRQEVKKQTKAAEYDNMDYDDLKQIVTDSCMAGHPNLEAMEALSRADAAGKWKTSKNSSDPTTINQNVDINEMREYILDKINEYRAEKGRTLLELNDELNDYAQIRAEEADVKFSHTRPDGSYCLDELAEMYPYSVMNENLATDYTYKDVAKAWYNSKGHKKNMIESRIDRCGIGVYNDTFAFIGLQDK